MRYNISNLSEIWLDDGYNRFDSEPFTFKKEKYNSKINSVKLKEISTINPSRTEISNISGNTECSFVSMANLGQGLISHKQQGKVNDYINNGYSYFRDGDIIIATITPCMEHGKCAIANTLTNTIGFGSTELIIVRLNDTDRFNREYLFSFLNREKVRKEAESHMVGTSGRQRVPSYFYKNLDIPILSKKFQNEIGIVVKKAKEMETQSLAFLEQAETILLQELDMINWQPEKNLSYIAKYSEVQKADELLEFAKAQNFSFVRG